LFFLVVKFSKFRNLNLRVLLYFHQLLKEITKVAKGKVLARSMPPEVIIQWSDKIDAIQVI